jgi:hypothetical protein
VRTATLLTCFAPSALKLYNGLKFDNEDQKKDIDAVLLKMEEACKGVTNETYERFILNTRSQKRTESVMEFYSELKKLAKNCNFGTLESSLLRDRLVVGIQDTTARKRLLIEKDLTLEKALEIARSMESTTSHLKTISEPTHADVAYLKQKHVSKKQQGGFQPKNPHTKQKPKQKADRLVRSNGGGAQKGQQQRSNMC